jgi:hypothetical protein
MTETDHLASASRRSAAEPLRSDRHAYAGCRALTERTRLGFDIAIARRVGGLFSGYSAALTRGRKDKRVDSALSV